MSWTQRLRSAAPSVSLPSTSAAPAARAAPRKMAALLMLGALASKILGFAREILMAQVLGASLLADGYRGAVTVILLPLCFLQNESAPAILIPMNLRARDSRR